MRTPDLDTLGWDAFFEGHFASHREAGRVPARVILEHQHLYRVGTGHSEPLAHVAGRFRHRATGRHEYPAVGDWVAIEPGDGHHRATIHAVLPRRSRFSRKAAGDLTEQQVVAANIDVVFLVSGLDADFNLRRIERYLVTAWDGGATPVVILNKADLCPNLEERLAQVAEIAAGVPVLAISSRERIGLEALEPYLGHGRTVALLGSSGVGKSTLINTLLGRDRQRTREVRESDSRGRHTTSHRELIVLPQGGLLIDTPGMRELQLWEGDAAIGETFDDVAALAADCYFRDCQHDTEPRCAVKAAVAAGTLAAGRLESFQKLRRELHHLETKVDARAATEVKRKWKIIHKSVRRITSKRI
jgi:ribosome biogenesis GTPase